MNESRFYLPMQLKALLEPNIYKVVDALFAYQQNGEVTYSSSTARMLHMDEEIADRAVQTIINLNLLVQKPKKEQYYVFAINNKVIEGYRSMDWNDAKKSDIINLADAVYFKQQQDDKKPASEQPNMEDMMAQLAQLQQQIAMMTSKGNKNDGLPY